MLAHAWGRYGEALDAMTLIPHMLEALMAEDLGFKRGRAGDSKARSEAKI